MRKSFGNGRGTHVRLVAVLNDAEGTHAVPTSYGFVLQDIASGKIIENSSWEIQGPGGGPLEESQFAMIKRKLAPFAAKGFELFNWGPGPELAIMKRIDYPVHLVRDSLYMYRNGIFRNFKPSASDDNRKFSFSAAFLLAFILPEETYKHMPVSDSTHVSQICHYLDVAILENGNINFDGGGGQVKKKRRKKRRKK